MTTEVIACRYCGRSDWNGRDVAHKLANRGNHEAAHRRKGDPLLPQYADLADVIGKGSRRERQAAKQAAKKRSTAATYLDAAGRQHSLHDQTPCEICGRADFETASQFDSHRNWHVRHKEAKWKFGISKGAGKQLVPTALGKSKFPQSETSLVPAEPINTEVQATPAPVQQPQTEQVVQHNVEINPAAEVLNTLTNGLVFLQLARIVQEMGSEQALQVLTSLRGFQGIPLTARKR